MNKQEVEESINRTMAFYRKYNKGGSEEYFQWQENYIRSFLYKNFGIKEK